MSVEKIPCSVCGAMILPRTASKTGGRCFPCKKHGKGLTYTIRITGCRKGAQEKISAATKAICMHTDQSLSDAKAVIDKCLDGGDQLLTVDSEVGAINLVKTLHEAGFDLELQ